MLHSGVKKRNQQEPFNLKQMYIPHSWTNFGIFGYFFWHFTVYLSALQIYHMKTYIFMSIA